MKNNKKQSEVKCGSVNLTKRASAFVLGGALVLCLTAANLMAQAPAALAPIDLGSAGTFAVLGASTVTNTGPTIVNGDLGVWPGTAYVPGTPSATVNGTIHTADTSAQQAQASLTIAYNNAAGRSTAPISVAGDLGGQTLAPGLYKSTSTLAITGDLTLDANGNPNAVYIFQVGSALTGATYGRVVLSGGAKAANVFWQVGSSATLGTYSALKGTVMAYASITMATGATLDGRALAQNAAVTLDTNAVTKQTSVTPPPPVPPTASAQLPVVLGWSGTFAVLGASTVTNTGPSIVNGDLGVWPGTAYVPGTPSATVNGTIHTADTSAQQEQACLTIAYNDAAGRSTAPISVAGDLGGQTLAPGLYKSTSTLAITGDLTLDANGNPNAVYIFQVGSALTGATCGLGVLSGGAKAANVFWQVGSSATLGTYSAFKGTVMAYASITMATGATLDGRALAQNAAVTLDTNAVTKQTSVTPPPPVPPTASAQLPVVLGWAGTFAVLGASTVTNTGPSIVNGDLGVWPGTAYVPGTPSATVNGTIHTADTSAQQEQACLTIAYNDAAGRSTAPISVAGDLGGQTLAPGLYKSTSTLAITGDLTLDANGDPNAVYIFQVGSALTVATHGRVVLSGGAKAANVFWQVGSSATLGTYSAFKGTVMAYASITIATGATLDGSALAQNAAVTLDTNAVTKQN